MNTKKTNLIKVTYFLICLFLNCIYLPFVGGCLGPVVMSLTSQVQGSSRSATWPDLKLDAFFPSGSRWQMWLEYHANFTCLQPLHTCIHVCMLGRMSVIYTCRRSTFFFREPRFPPPIKLIATIWPKMLKLALNTNQSNSCHNLKPHHHLNVNHLSSI